jgi:hypothetical protein
MRHRTSKVECFADDNNVLALLDRLGIETIKQILHDFAILSGLQCNVEKSQILILGTNTVPDYIIESGFSVANEIKILGFNITRNAGDLWKNIEPAIEKIRNTATFWNRYRLSLPGRINVAKTLMLSQINFHASIIEVPPEKTDEIQRAVNTFVTGSFNFDKDRICTSPATGGLGMININNFISSLHCSWLQKAHREVIDNWRYRLVNLAGGNCTSIDPQRHEINPAAYPVLSTIANSFWKFKSAFFAIGRNFFHSPIFGNPRLINNKRDKIPADMGTLFENVPDPIKERLKSANVHDFTEDGVNFLSQADLRANNNIDLDLQIYNTLKSIIKDSWQVLKKYSKSETGVALDFFLGRFKKGSKPFRKIFDNLGVIMIESKPNRRTATFFNLIAVQKPEKNILRILNSQWATTVYPVGLREFVFKLRNNILGLNTRVSHFNNNINRGCTFCALSGTINPPDESFEHLFYSCAHTKRIWDNFFNKYLNCDPRDSDVVKKFLFTGMGPDFTEPNFFLLTVMSIGLHFIWQCKLQKRLPVNEGLLNEIFFVAGNIIKVSNNMRNTMNLNLPLCRNWAAESSRRRF